MKFNLFTVVFIFCAVISVQTAMATCPDKGNPAIDIKMTSKPIAYDFTLTQQQLLNFDIDTKSPYDQGAHVEIGGLMNGEIAVNTNVSFGWASQSRTGQTCYWYDTITVTMHITPTIYVAKEHPQGTCMHDAILHHEMKHIEVDRWVLRKYARMLDEDLQRVTQKVGVVGPVSRQSADRTREKMMEIIERAVSARAERMYAERRERQQAVDSLEEYERVTKSCR